ncbi:MAG: hypothetical protein IJK18_01805 [Clostridia bacterium]|nr:hypothetical protein [Clostridia bacterium]
MERLEDGSILQDIMEFLWNNECIFLCELIVNGKKMVSCEVMAQERNQSYRIALRTISDKRFLFSQTIHNFNFDRHNFLNEENSPYVPYEQKYWENAESGIDFISNLIKDRSFADLSDADKVFLQNPLGKVEISENKRTELILLLAKIRNALQLNQVQEGEILNKEPEGR